MVPRDSLPSGADARRPGVAPHTERRALTWSAVIAAFVIAWIVRPLGVGIFLGMLMGFATQPLFERAARRVKPQVAALTTVTATTLAIVAVVGGLGTLLVTQGVTLTRALLAALAPGGAAGGAVAEVTGRAASIGLPPEFIEAKLREGAAGLAARAAEIAEGIASATAGAALELFFAMLSMYFVFQHWPRLSAQAQVVLPLRPAYTRELFAELRRVGRTTLLGTVVTGIAQGLLATIGFALGGVPEPTFFGALTAVASLVPAVGTMLVWAPAGALLILTGHTARGAIVLAWGALLVVGAADYVLRPRLVGAESRAPSLVTFAAIFGGVEVFGLEGLVLGPVLMLVAVAVLRLYAQESEARRGAADRAPEALGP